MALIPEVAIYSSISLAPNTLFGLPVFPTGHRAQGYASMALLEHAWNPWAFVRLNLAPPAKDSPPIADPVKCNEATSCADSPKTGTEKTPCARLVVLLMLV